MNKTKQTYIKEIEEIKQGVSAANKEWHLYRITDAENIRYTTFDVFLLGKAYESGTEVVLEYTEEPSGRVNEKTGEPYMNRSIVSVKVAQPVADDIAKRLGDLEQAFLKVEAALRNVGIEIPE